MRPRVPTDGARHRRFTHVPERPARRMAARLCSAHLPAVATTIVCVCCVTLPTRPAVVFRRLCASARLLPPFSASTRTQQPVLANPAVVSCAPGGPVTGNGATGAPSTSIEADQLGPRRLSTGIVPAVRPPPRAQPDLLPPPTRRTPPVLRGAAAASAGAGTTAAPPAPTRDPRPAGHELTNSRSACREP